MSVSVGQFYEAGKENLSLELEYGGEYFSRHIPEQALNRPGLALTGFFQHFSHRRIQVIGLAESDYLQSLDAGTRLSRVRDVCRHDIPCILLSRGRRAMPEIREAAEEYHIPVMRSPMITSRLINAATLIMENLTAPTIRVQGTMVEIMGIGVLLQGPPGLGKSETALALIERGHSLVSDDVTVLHRDSEGFVIGSAVDVTRYHMEIRGLGIIHVPSLFGVSSMRNNMRLDLVIQMHPWDPAIEVDRTGLNSEKTDMMGVSVPLIRLPVAPGRDMAQVIEVAARNQKLKLLGHDAAKELDEKLVGILTRKAQA
ncbi:MAG: HPr(Ser) kinase/phosphatase [Kiritimatiellia bacterium]